MCVYNIYIYCVYVYIYVDICGCMYMYVCVCVYMCIYSFKVIYSFILDVKFQGVLYSLALLSVTGILTSSTQCAGSNTLKRRKITDLHVKL